MELKGNITLTNEIVLSGNISASAVLAEVQFRSIKGEVEDNAKLVTKFATKQNNLTDPQLNAVNSGITAAKVASYDDKVKVVRNASGTLVFYKETYTE